MVESMWYGHGFFSLPLFLGDGINYGEISDGLAVRCLCTSPASPSRFGLFLCCISNIGERRGQWAFKLLCARLMGNKSAGKGVSTYNPTWLGFAWKQLRSQ
ncbi:uncharacterized protein LOC101781972 isoform X1 [Setaria italica]|uniref:uncharacterized protein LOC101781972 isoform X1 n=1 Tax=Setaria italica TaxID=4555 RepID=UPI0003510D60|nr:uncharacterized protein LOC101781972 isoform X1 [Setaria italica]